jgi:hypothetical protein
MGALHFIDPPLVGPDVTEPTVFHELELFEHGGNRFLRIKLGGNRAPSEVTMQLTRRQAAQLAQAAEGLRDRVLD